jgi:hypothetical protein
LFSSWRHPFGSWRCLIFSCCMAVLMSRGDNLRRLNAIPKGVGGTD